MTTKEQKKQQKKNARDKDNRKKLLAKREAIAAPLREERDQFRKLKRVGKMKKDMGKFNVWPDEVLMSMSNDTLSQLEKNAKILRALEEEYQQEYLKKENLNKELEVEGYHTLEEKLNSLHNRMVDHFAKSMVEAGLPGNEELTDEAKNLNERLENMRESLAPIEVSDTSEVEVIKAPVEVSEVEVIKAST